MTLTEAALLAEREGGEAAEDEVIACSDICEVCATMETERHEELHRERFHSTPLELFMEMLRSVLEREPQDRARAEWRRERMRQATEQTTAETEHEDEAADVGGLEKPAAATGLRSVDPDPDGFVEGTLRLPPGHARATAIAEAVLLDRVQELLDRHYDEVFTRSWLDAHVAPATSGGGVAGDTEAVAPAALGKGLVAPEESVGPREAPSRRGAFRVVASVLEARLAQRYEAFRLPLGVTALLRKPRDETSWAKVEELASLVLDLAEGIQEVRDVDASQLATLREAVESSATETGGRHRVTQNVELQDLMIPANSRLVTDVFLAAPPCLVRVQKSGWKAMPLSPFGVHLQKNALAAKAMRVEASARAWHAGIGGATVLTAAGVVTHLLLDLGFVLWQQQCLQWQRDWEGVDQ
jgi:hypothetical protein